MTEPNFAPKPWQILATDNPSLVAVYDNINDMVCDHIDDEDNAALIAAAPDMYASLQNCVNLLRHLGINEFANMVETTLRKARGESEARHE